MKAKLTGRMLAHTVEKNRTFQGENKILVAGRREEKRGGERRKGRGLGYFWCSCKKN